MFAVLSPRESVLCRILVFPLIRVGSFVETPFDPFAPVDPFNPVIPTDPQTPADPFAPAMPSPTPTPVPDPTDIFSNGDFQPH